MPFQAIIYDFAVADKSGIDEDTFIGCLESLLIKIGCDIATFFLCSPWEIYLKRNDYKMTWQERFLCLMPCIQLKDTLHRTLLDSEKFLYH